LKHVNFKLDKMKNIILESFRYLFGNKNKRQIQPYLGKTFSISSDEFDHASLNQIDLGALPENNPTSISVKKSAQEIFQSIVADEDFEHLIDITNKMVMGKKCLISVEEDKAKNLQKSLEFLLDPKREENFKSDYHKLAHHLLENSSGLNKKLGKEFKERLIEYSASELRLSVKNTSAKRFFKPLNVEVSKYD